VVNKGLFEGAFPGAVATADIDDEDVAAGAWGPEIDIVEPEEGFNGEAVIVDGEVIGDEEERGDDEEGGWDNLDLDIPADAAVPEVSHEAAYFVTPSAGIPKSQNWIQNSSLAGEHAAAGSFDSAMRLLSRQLGIQNFTPLRNVFLELHLASQALLPTLVSVPGLSLFLERGWTDSSPINAKGSPAILTKLSSLEEKLNVAYKATTDGKFPDALRFFLDILHTIPVVVVDSRKEVDEVKELLGIAKEYTLALKIELKRKDPALKDDLKRQCELAAYFTHCQMQPTHLKLSLMSAMTICFKSKNYSTAASIARRLLELNLSPAMASKARQVLQVSERNPKNEIELNYDPRNPFVVCGATFTPIYRGTKDVSCPYCKARFVPDTANKLCPVCDLALVGADASGLLCSTSQMR
jgi:coatomer protein complex subunit alpha (xenin)